MAAYIKLRALWRVCGISLLILAYQASFAESPNVTSGTSVTARSFVGQPELTPPFSLSLSSIHMNSVPVARENTGLFHVPLLGDLKRMGLRTAIGDGGQFDRLHQYALFVDFDLPALWSPWPEITAEPRFVFEVGRFHLGDDNRTFASFGPAVRFTNLGWRTPLFMDLGLSPTVIDGSRYDDRDLGTSLNFTSHIALGMRFGQQREHSVKLRYQHISNGGTNHTNPGANMIGLDFTFWRTGR